MPQTKKTAKIKVATKRLIDTLWVLRYEEVDEATIRIISHQPEALTYKEERELPRFRLMEDNKRVVLAAAIQPYRNGLHWAKIDDPDTKRFEVMNQKNVFSYDGEVVS